MHGDMTLGACGASINLHDVERSIWSVVSLMTAWSPIPSYQFQVRLSLLHQSAYSVWKRLKIAFLAVVPQVNGLPLYRVLQGLVGVSDHVASVQECTPYRVIGICE